MKYLFTENGLRILESLCFTKTLFAFDFDGTLARIVQDPAAAKMAKYTEEILKKLSRVSEVAIISGRKLGDIKRRLPFDPGYIIGNHGLESIISDRFSIIEAQKASQTWKRQLCSPEYKQTFRLGTELEDKEYTLALHYRKTRNRGKTRSMLKEIIQQLDPKPRVIPGKCVFNLVPYGSPHKGVALLELMNKFQMKSAFYIGDDDTDEDVFSLPHSKIFTVRVGVKRSSQAQYFIHRQSEINQVLETILGFYETAPRT